MTVAATRYFQVIVFGWVAGSLLGESRLYLFNYSTTDYYVLMLFGTDLNCIL